jgi:hypothetical protein
MSYNAIHCYAIQCHVIPCNAMSRNAMQISLSRLSTKRTNSITCPSILHMLIRIKPAITTLPLPRSNYDPYKHQHYLTKPLQAITIPPQYPLTPCMLSQYNNMLLLLSATATPARPHKDTIMLRHLYKYAYYYCLAILCIICTPPCQHITCTIPPNNYCPMI